MENAQISHAYRATDGPPVFMMDTQLMEMEDMTATAVKQNAQDMNPSNPRMSSCLYPMRSSVASSSLVTDPASSAPTDEPLEESRRSRVAPPPFNTAVLL